MNAKFYLVVIGTALWIGTLVIYLINRIIYTIFEANINKCPKKAQKIALKQPVIERLRMRYVQQYIALYAKQYMFYLKLRLYYIIYWIISLLFLILVFYVISEEMAITVFLCKLCFEVVFAFILKMKFDTNHKTKFNR